MTPLDPANLCKLRTKNAIELDIDAKQVQLKYYQDIVAGLEAELLQYKKELKELEDE